MLGGEDFAFAAPLWGFDGPPFFEGSGYVLHLPGRLDEVAAARKLSRDALLAELAGPRAKLFAARAERKRPLTDDKVLADWNGMAISGLATAGRLLGEPELVRRAAAAADFALTHLWVEQAGGGRRLFHAWRGGEAKIAAFLSDYAYLVRGLLALDEATGSTGAGGGRWLRAAEELTAEQVTRLRAPQGGFYEAAERPDLLFRSQDVFDGATPSANAVAVLDLLELARRTGHDRWRREAEAALAAFAPQIERFPDGARMMAVAVRRFHQAEADGGAAGAAPEKERVGAEGEAAEADSKSAAGATGALAGEARRAVTIDAEVGAPGEGGWRPFRLVLTIAPGWHVNANPASDPYLIPTEVKGKGGTVRGLLYPAPEQLQPSYAAEPIAIYQGKVEVTGEVHADQPGADAGLLLTYQACDAERCLPPVTREVEIP